MEKTLFVIRHAIAEDREEFAKRNTNDDQRPLTNIGKKKMQMIAEKLQSLENIDIICQSPLVRSQQTAKILTEAFPKSKLIELQSLTPSHPILEVIKDLNTYSAQSTAIVGHESHISNFLSYILSGSTNSFVTLKKGGIAKLTYTGKLTPKNVQLHWLVTPKVFLKT